MNIISKIFLHIAAPFLFASLLFSCSGNERLKQKILKIPDQIKWKYVSEL